MKLVSSFTLALLVSALSFPLTAANTTDTCPKGGQKLGEVCLVTPHSVTPYCPSDMVYEAAIGETPAWCVYCYEGGYVFDPKSKSCQRLIQE